MELKQYFNDRIKSYQILNELVSTNYSVLDTFSHTYPGHDVVDNGKSLPIPKTERQDIEYERLMRKLKERTKLISSLRQKIDVEKKYAEFENFFMDFLSLSSEGVGCNYEFNQFYDNETKSLSVTEFRNLVIQFEENNPNKKMIKHFNECCTSSLLLHKRFIDEIVIQDLFNAYAEELDNKKGLIKPEALSQIQHNTISIPITTIEDFVKKSLRFINSNMDERNLYISRINKYASSSSDVLNNEELQYFSSFITFFDYLTSIAMVLQDRINASKMSEKKLNLRSKIQDRITPAESTTSSYKPTQFRIHACEFEELLKNSIEFASLQADAEKLSAEYFNSKVKSTGALQTREQAEKN